MMLGEVGEGIASLDFKWWSGLDTLDPENFITWISVTLRPDFIKYNKSFMSPISLNE